MDHRQLKNSPKYKVTHSKKYKNIYISLTIKLLILEFSYYCLEIQCLKKSEIASKIGVSEIRSRFYISFS